MSALNCGACAVPEVPGVVIQRGRPIAAAYQLLVRRIRQAPAGSRLGLAFERDRLERLPSHHELLLHGALHLASAAAPDRNRAGFRGRLAGPGRPAAQLRDSREEIARQPADVAAGNAQQAQPGGTAGNRDGRPR